MNKYKRVLLEKIKKQLYSWFNKEQRIDHEELYRFIHSLAGTAPTIGLNRIGEISEALMKQLKESEDSKWSKLELEQFLLPLFTACYDEDISAVSEETAVVAEAVEKELIILVDDDVTLLMFLKEELEKNGYAVIAFTEPDKALASCYDLDPSCIVIDVHMKGKNGLDVLVELKDFIKKRFIPVLVFSVDKTKEVRVSSYRLGADDFIQKPFDYDEFLVRLNRQLEKKRNIDELILLDELTRIYNRKIMPSIYERCIGRLRREKETFCMAILDLDHFKKVNDTYGHQTGDCVLIEFAQCIKKAIRANDIAIRYGGEEFILIFPDANVQQALEVLDRLKQTFSGTVFTTKNEQFTCTFSAGVMEIVKEQHERKTIELVDAALYQANNSGRTQVQIVQSEEVKYEKKALNVAIVDDDPIIRTILNDLFQKSTLSNQFSLTIVTFKDGMDFIDSGFHQQRGNHFVVLDGMMPKMDGIEVLQTLRKLDNQHLFTIMMLTSRKDEKDIARALNLGADDYMTKPFHLLELESRLYHLVKRMK